MNAGDSTEKREPKKNSAPAEREFVRQSIRYHFLARRCRGRRARERNGAGGADGLLGLAGLIPKKRHVEVHQARDTGSNRVS